MGNGVVVTSTWLMIKFCAGVWEGFSVNWETEFGVYASPHPLRIRVAKVNNIALLYSLFILEDNIHLGAGLVGSRNSLLRAILSPGD